MLANQRHRGRVLVVLLDAGHRLFESGDVVAALIGPEGEVGRVGGARVWRNQRSAARLRKGRRGCDRRKEERDCANVLHAVMVVLARMALARLIASAGPLSCWQTA